MNRYRLVRTLALIGIPLTALLTAAPPDKTATPAVAQPQSASGGPSSASDKITLSRPTASVELMAEPSKVWKKLVSAEGLAAFGMVGTKRKSLEKVGDHVAATLSGDAGTLVVTHVSKESDWRAAFEPEKGNYVCSIRFELRPQGNNTLLVFSDWYSDEKPDRVEQNLKETERSMVEGLARFKGVIEKTTAAGEP